MPTPGSFADIYHYLFSDKPEREFSLSVPKEKARKYGQYFTPYPVARYMADWVNQNRSINLVLDPAAGLGIFFRAVMEGHPNFSGTFFGYEIDFAALEKLKGLFVYLPSVKNCFISENYLSIEDDRKYDAILCNPPYIQYKRIPNRKDLIKRVEGESGLHINPQSNVYSYFIIRAALALATNGRAAFLVPSEFLNSEFGIPIKEFLIRRNLIKKILLFDAQSSIFPDAITTSSILLLENNQQKDPIQFARLIQQGQSTYLSDLNTPPHPEINPAQKWSARLISKPITKHSRRLIPLSQIGRVSRGIATGDNRFFTFDNQKIKRYEIPARCLLPCLTRASQARTSIFSQIQFEHLANSGKSVYLLDASLDPENSSIQAYIRFGEANKSHNRFLTRSRDPWYRIENRPPAPILFTTFSRNQLRFIRNEANVYNLTCFH